MRRTLKVVAVGARVEGVVRGKDLQDLRSEDLVHSAAEALLWL